SEKTIRRELRKLGYASRVAVNKPFLNESNKKQDILLQKIMLTKQQMTGER
ncbi:hypothetical protein BCV72DRAFT_218197, partial [Rhizopus microsporus var. microsporus]